MTSQKYQPVVEALLAAVKTTANNAVIGFLPPIGGVSLFLSGGDVKTDMAGNRYGTLRITLAAKDTSQLAAVQLLDAAHSAVRGMTASGTDWQISGVRVPSPPQLASQDAQGNWILQSVILANYLSEGGT